MYTGQPTKRLLYKKAPDLVEHFDSSVLQLLIKVVIKSNVKGGMTSFTM